MCQLNPRQLAARGCAKPQAQRPCVLLVDDHAVNRLVLGTMLAKLGFDVREACDGLQAVQHMRRELHPVCLVLLDLQMPVLDGWSAARLLRQEHGVSLPILACTASDLSAPHPDGATVQQHALDCGADMCLNKPLGVQQLQAALQQLHVLEAAPQAGCPAAAPPAAAAVTMAAPCASQSSKELPTVAPTLLEQVL